jgi:hypothetical protein
MRLAYSQKEFESLDASVKKLREATLAVTAKA